MSVSSIVDIVFVALLILLAVIGLYRGFLKSAISMVGTAASALIAWVLAKPFGKLLQLMFKLTTKLTEKVVDWLYSLSEFFSLTRSGESFGEISGEMTSGGVSGIVQKLTNMLLKGANIPEGKSVGQVLGGKIAAVLTTIIAFIVAFILIRIILKILEKLSDKITEVKIFGAVDKILGFIFGLLKGLLYSGIVVVVFSVIGYFVPAIDSKVYGIVGDTKAFQKYYDFLNYEITEIIDDKLGKNDKPAPSVIEIAIADFDATDLEDVTHAFVLRNEGEVNGKIYFANEALTAKNFGTKADFFVKFADEAELEAIMTIVVANDPAIELAYKEVAVTKTLAEIKELFSTVTHFYVDTTEKVVVFKVANSDIDIENYIYDGDYIVTFADDTALTAIRDEIATYNATAEVDLIETQAPVAE